MGTVWTGDVALFFAGETDSGFTDAIVSFDPATGDVRTTGAKFPTPRYGMSAVWAGDVAYVFGGYGCGVPETHCDAIFRYDPVEDSLVELAAKLPSAREHTTATWDGESAFVMGGKDASQSCLDDVVRFTPTTGEVVVLSAKLPVARFAAASAWVADRALVFGGNRCGGYLDDVVAFDPVAGTAVTRTARLPKPIDAMGVAAMHGAVFVAAGTRNHPHDFSDEVLRYDVAGDVFTTSEARLPLSLQGPAAFAVGDDMFVLGGRLPSTLAHTDRIYRFTTSPFSPPSPPRALAAAPATLGEVALSWEPPAFSGGLPITGYSLYRGASSGTATLLASLGDVTSFVDHLPEPAPGVPNVQDSYFYVVRAANARGLSAASNEACSAGVALPAGASPPTSAPCASPGLKSRDLFRHTLRLAEATIPAARLGEGYVSLRAAPWGPDPSYYAVDARVAGLPLPTVRFLAPASLPRASADSPAVETPGESLGGGTIAVRVAALYDPSRATCVLAVGPACVHAPVGAGDAEWLVDAGGASALVVEIDARDADGATIARASLVLPFAGQSASTLGA